MPLHASATSYPSRLHQGPTSLVTPLSLRGLSNNTATRTQTTHEPELSFRGSSTRPRPSYRDTSLSPPPLRDQLADIDPETGLPLDRQGVVDLEVDERGFVTQAPPHSLYVARPRGWIRQRSEYVLAKAAELEELLLPIRLDLPLPATATHAELHLKDVFLWNINEELITPSEFAYNLALDLGISQVHVATIAQDIRKQIEEYAPVVEKIRLQSESLIVVELGVHLSRHLITDKFEWDLQALCASQVKDSDDNNSPASIKEERPTVEEFAKITCADLGLHGEFVPALSHAIHESLISLTKQIAESGLPLHNQNDCAFDKPAGLRVSTDTLGLDWVPSIEILTREEIEKRDGERSREVRRLRREASRFGSSAVPRDLQIGGRKRGRREFEQEPGEGGLSEVERKTWKCVWCRVSGLDVWSIYSPPDSNSNSNGMNHNNSGDQAGKAGLIHEVKEKQFCRFCGIRLEKEGALAEWRKGLFSSRLGINVMPMR